MYYPYMLAPLPCVKFPSKIEKFKFSVFVEKVDVLVDTDRLICDSVITDNKSFVDRYKKLTDLIN